MNNTQILEKIDTIKGKDKKLLFSHFEEIVGDPIKRVEVKNLLIEVTNKEDRKVLVLDPNDLQDYFNNES